MEIKINGINKIENAWKNYNIVINQVELENGDMCGTFEGKLIMEQSKKISNQDIMNLLSKIDTKIDLMIKTPTMNSEIDHEALAKIDLN